MSTTRLSRVTAALAAVALMSVAACSNNAATSSSGSEATASDSSSITAKEPDVNGDGTVKIGVLSPGDLNDNGYYESFVTEAQAFTDAKSWELIKVGSVNPADALEQARNMCRQGVDMVALAAAELADAVPASEEAVCANTAWYVPSSAGNVEVTPRITVSSDDVHEVLLAAGYGIGLLMEDAGKTSAGFVSGPEADFSIAAAKAFRAGIRQVIPSGQLLTTYTGDFNNSALAVEATRAQIQQGIGGLYPYLGGATDAAAAIGFGAGIPVATPGTDRCAENTFAMSVIFDPGEYFGAALQEFAEGKLQMGAERKWKLGVDQVPAITLCNGTAEQKQKLADFISQIGSGAVQPTAVIAAQGS